MHTRKHYNNPTPPKRCDALVVGEDDSKKVCRKKVYRAGMCIDHYAKWRLARTERGIYDTVRIIGNDNGKPIYNPPLITEKCVGRYGRCIKRPAINYEKSLYCMACFMRYQKGLPKPMEEVA